MIKYHEKRVSLRARRRRRVKKKFDRFDGKMRLVVTRSARHITGQIVDDIKGQTLISASSIEKAMAPEVKAAESKTDLANRIGKVLAQRAKEKKITQVVFDRNGYAYHGRVKALAEGAREGGLKI